jgi:hypothetical protein
MRHTLLPFTQFTTHQKSAKHRLALRKHQKSTSLESSPPLPDEISLIHTLYLQSKSKHFLEETHTTPLTRPSAAAIAPTTSGKTELLIDGVHVIKTHEDTPTTVSPHIVSTTATLPVPKPYRWMSATVFSNTQFQHLQNRNIHGKIFGGHIMKQAFELAWVTAVCSWDTAYTTLFTLIVIQLVCLCVIFL